MKSKLGVDNCPICGEKLRIQLDEHFEEIWKCSECGYWEYTEIVEDLIQK